jgi:hypothetical protein
VIQHLIKPAKVMAKRQLENASEPVAKCTKLSEPDLLSLPADLIRNKIFPYLDSRALFTLKFTCRLMNMLLFWIFLKRDVLLLYTQSPSNETIPTLCSWMSDNSSYIYPALLEVLASLGSYELIGFAHNCLSRDPQLMPKLREMMRSTKIMQCAFNSGKFLGIAALRKLGFIGNPDDAHYAAIECGNIRMLDCLHSIGRGILFNSFEVAARHGQINVLNWLCAKHGMPLGGLFVRVIDIAAQHGHINVLEWAVANGGSLAYTSCPAARNGHLHVIKWIVEHGCPRNLYAIQYALQAGHMDIAEYLYSRGWKINCNACYEVAKDGHLASVLWMRSRGASWGSFTRRAVADDDLKLLKWGHENGAPWSTSSLILAAYRGHTDIVEYLVENGAPLSNQAVNDAANRGHLAIFQYLIANGCPYTRAGIMRSGTPEIKIWIKTHM